MNNIVIFDSGCGGLGVLKELCLLLGKESRGRKNPNCAKNDSVARNGDFRRRSVSNIRDHVENPPFRDNQALLAQSGVIYYGDTANAPYGSKPQTEIAALAKSAADKLYKYGFKALVVACNTVTGAVIEELRSRYPDAAVIGAEPALKPAVVTKEGKILLLATPATLRQEKFTRLYEQYGDNRIILSPQKDLAFIIEQNFFDSAHITRYIAYILAPYEREDISGIVLGCTHYTLVKDCFAEALHLIFKRQIAIFDGNLGIARRTADLINPPFSAGQASLVQSVGFASSQQGRAYVYRDMFFRLAPELEGKIIVDFPEIF